jgi:uncharacterized cupredoxin-like copper-binding protein
VRRAIATLVAFGVLAAPAAAAAPTTAVGVSEREWRISSYRASVKPGSVKLNIHNYGEDAHNVVVRGPKGFKVVGPDVESGANATLKVSLKRTGTYTLYCSKPGHLKLGMKTRITVKR